MSFQLQTTASQLQALMSRVSGVIRKNCNVPILSNVKMIGTEGKLCLTGSNQELEITASKDIGVIHGVLATTVDAHKLNSILSTVPGDDSITLSSTKMDAVEVKGAFGRFKLATQPVADFPTFTPFTNGAERTTIQVKEEDLKDLLNRLSFAMGIADTRYYLNALHLQFKKQALTATASNGHHMATDTLSLETAVTQLRSVVLPRTTVLDFQKQLSGVSDLVTLEFDDACMRATFDCVTYLSKLSENKYPDISQVRLPVCKRAHINRESLRLAAQRVQILAGDSKHVGVKLSILPDMAGGVLRLDVRNANNEEAEVDVVFENAGVQGCDFGLNIAYLIEALRSVEDTCIDLAVPLDGGPALMTVPGLPDFRYLIMPMRL